MPSKDPEIRKATWNKWYKKNKTKHHKRCASWTKRRRKTIKDLILNYKKEHPCIECGFSNPLALDFHHLDPTQKEISIANITSMSWHTSKIKAEIAKCIVLCSNCHRIKHGSSE